MTATAQAAIGFIPIAMAPDDDVMAEVKQHALLSAALMGTVVGDIELTWNESAHGYDARAMVIPL